MTKSPKQPVIQSVSRAVAVLRCFSEEKKLGLTEISRIVGLHKSTTAGIVNTLTAERFLEQDEQSGKFRLGLDLYCLAVRARLELNEICEPYLNRLLEATGETVNLAVRDGDQVVYIDKKESPHSMRIFTSVGKRMPIYCTAIGKAILAFLPDNQMREILDGIDTQHFTDKTVTEMQRLVGQLPVIREQGVAFDLEEWECGLICIAAPVLDKRGEAICAVSVSGPSVRMGETERANIEASLKRAVSGIGEEARAVGLS